MSSTDVETLVRLLTRERLRSYLAITSNEAAALTLYDWNTRASAEVLATVAMVEVLVRNALDDALQSWAHNRHRVTEWFDISVLDARGTADLALARSRAATSGPPPHGKVVAELNLGFWRYLVAWRYHTALWVPAAHRAFPHGSQDLRVRRREVERRMADLLLVRNRAAHHEPIHRRNLAKDHRDAVQLASWIDAAAGAWVHQQSRLATVAQSRPTTSL